MFSELIAKSKSEAPPGVLLLKWPGELVHPFVADCTRKRRIPNQLTCRLVADVVDILVVRSEAEDTLMAERERMGVSSVQAIVDGYGGVIAQAVAVVLMVIPSGGF